MTFAKIKIENTGKFECKNIDELESLVKDIKLKYSKFEVKKIRE